MDYFDTLTEQRIDSPTADLVDDLCNQYASTLTPCEQPLHTALQQLAKEYPLQDLPQDSIHHARTALAVIEANFPEDAEYLPYDPEERLQAAYTLIPTLHLDIHCTEVVNQNTGCFLYQQQQTQFEQRTAGYDLTWTPMPIRICAETTTGYCLITGSDILSNRMICLRGVSQQDIDTRTPVLIAYLRAKYAKECV